MSDDGPDVLARELDRMRADYQHDLRRELAALRKLAAMLAENPPRDAPWTTAARELRDRLHRLAGGAGTFGFTAVGESCRTHERRLDTVIEADDARAVRALAAEIETDLSTQRSQLENEAAALPPAWSREQRRGDDETTTDLHTRTDSDGVDARVYVALLASAQDAESTTHKAIRSLGYNVDFFSDVERLAAACELRPPKAVIIDRDHRDRSASSGIAAGEWLNARRTGPALPLLMIGEATDFDEQLRAVRAGVEAFFTEPLVLISIAEHIDRLVRQEQVTAPRVLMVDDDEATLDFHRVVLENRGFEVMALDRPEIALDAVSGFAPDVIVLDVNMPRCSGPELAQMLRYNARWLQVPIVYLSAVADVGRQIQAMTRAGDDFIVKPVAPDALVAALNSRVRRARTLARLMSSDSLTGLLNHADIKQRLVRVLEERQAGSRPLCVAMIDIDHFKSVNDTYGHPVGDEVIQTLANMLRRRLRTSDFVGRYGGEEFMAVLHNCGLADAHRILDDLRTTFAGLSFVADGRRFTATFSAGIHQPEPTQDAEVAIATADRYLYRAKKTGRNRIADCDHV